MESCSPVNFLKAAASCAITLVSTMHTDCMAAISVIPGKAHKHRLGIHPHSKLWQPLGDVQGHIVCVLASRPAALQGQRAAQSAAATRLQNTSTSKVANRSTTR